MNKILPKPSINLKYSTILNKKFKTHLSGYDAIEVDLFFDQVIADYKAYEEYFLYLTKVLKQKDEIINNKDQHIEKLMIKVNSLEERSNYLLKTPPNQFLIKEIDELKKKIDSESE